MLQGTVTDAATLQPKGFVPVKITITNGTFIRSLKAFPDLDGTFSVPFNPVGNERGIMRSPPRSPAPRRRRPRTCSTSSA